MRRGLLILLGLLAVAWFEFEVYPGHSYLQGETQLLVPMLERLDTPGFLSRDLVAANPTFAYTIYDEITQSLHAGARLTIEQALSRQQELFRFAAIIGVFLLARALKVSPVISVLLSAAVNAVTHLAAPAAFVTSAEPTPDAFAFSLVLLAAGLMANRLPLLAGISAGLALLYDPVTAAPFWLVAAVASIADKSLRRWVRPAWPALVIFSLILGNLVQLQAGLGGGQELTARMTDAMIQLTRLRTPWAWPSGWSSQSYVFLLVAGLWALTFIWKHTDRLTRWLTLGLALSGFVSMALSLILLARRAQFAVEMTPSRNLAFTVAITVLSCGAAAFHAARKSPWDSAAWLALVIAAILNAQVLDLLHGKLDLVRRAPRQESLRDLAQWAAHDTWGSSLFHFPDAGRGDNPGIFRALSKRALWADWRSGEIADSSDRAGQEWWARWQSDMSRPYSPDSLQQTLHQPIDYYVLDRLHALPGVKPAYENALFVVYDAQDLRERR